MIDQTPEALKNFGIIPKMLADKLHAKLGLVVFATNLAVDREPTYTCGRERTDTWPKQPEARRCFGCAVTPKVGKGARWRMPTFGQVSKVGAWQTTIGRLVFNKLTFGHAT